jgi:hypothetical protein
VTIGLLIDNRFRDAQRTWLPGVIVFLALPWTLGALEMIYDWKIDRDIASRQETTYGVITAHDPANHNSYGYVFSVNGKTFNGWQSPKEDELAIGKRVTVLYDRRDPTRNALTDFRDLAMVSLGPLNFGVVVSGIMALMWYFLPRRRRRPSADPPA